MQSLRKFFNLNTKNMENTINPNCIQVIGPYDIENPEFDKTYNSQRAKEAEKLYTLEKIMKASSKFINEEFNLLDSLFEWGKSKNMIKLHRQNNIYSDVAPFEETAVLINK